MFKIGERLRQKYTRDSSTYKIIDKIVHSSCLETYYTIAGTYGDIIAGISEDSLNNLYYKIE